MSQLPAAGMLTLALCVVLLAATSTAIAVPQAASTRVVWNITLSGLPNYWGGGAPMVTVMKSAQPGTVRCSDLRRWVLATPQVYYTLVSSSCDAPPMLLSSLQGSWSPYPPALSHDGVLCPVTFFIDDGKIGDEPNFPPQIFGFDLTKAPVPVQLWNHSNFTDIEVPVAVRAGRETYFAVGSVYYVTIFSQRTGAEVLNLRSSFPVALRVIPASPNMTEANEAVVYEWGHDSLILTALQPAAFHNSRLSVVRWNVSGPAGLDYPTQRSLTHRRCVYISEGHGVAEPFYTMWSLAADTGALQFALKVNLPGASTAHKFVSTILVGELGDGMSFVAAVATSNGYLQFFHGEGSQPPILVATIPVAIPVEKEAPPLALCASTVSAPASTLIVANGTALLVLSSDGSMRRRIVDPWPTDQVVAELLCSTPGRVAGTSRSITTGGAFMWELDFSS